MFNKIKSHLIYEKTFTMDFITIKLKKFEIYNILYYTKLLLLL